MANLDIIEQKIYQKVVVGVIEYLPLEDSQSDNTPNHFVLVAFLFTAALIFSLCDLFEMVRGNIH